ncbi:hypothetical protein, partial [Klebsiella pneumoniae]|uniref:hypothetical protein n=1 Tax=Klebsiella pneumoniae TaxID=573 RepID=UPI001CA31DAD
KTQPATGETYPKSDLFNKAGLYLTVVNDVNLGSKFEMRLHCRGNNSASHYLSPAGNTKLTYDLCYILFNKR